MISIDTKKKEILGNYKNVGKEWAPKGAPQKVKIHDFIDKKLGKAIPYGVYDIGQNKGFVSVGVDNDTAEFAVETIRRWWNGVGRCAYNDASQLYITADGGGSNASRSRLFKLELQKFADETNLTITVSHYPPGTSKWNKIEHRMFCHITANWRAVPLETREIVVELISHTTTSKGLTIHAALDTNTYAKGRSVTKKEFDGLVLTNANRPLLKTQDLNQIFTIKENRHLSKNLTLQYKNVIYQIVTNRQSYALRGAKVTVSENKECEIRISYKGNELEYYVHHLQEKQGESIEAKRLDAEWESLIEEPQKKKYIPKPNHPWKRTARRRRILTM